MRNINACSKVRFIMKKDHIIILTLLSILLFVNAQQFRLRTPEFVLESDSAKQMADTVQMMTQRLRSDLEQRADIEFVEEGEQGAKCQCVVKNIQFLKNVFSGTEYKAWHTRVTALVQVQVEINGQKITRKFSVTRRLRSTTGEPQLDAALFNGMAKDIVNQCYGELVDIVECN